MNKNIMKVKYYIKNRNYLKFKDSFIYIYLKYLKILIC